MSKVGLVLEGGGMRGAYTSGVLDYFMEQGLFFRHITGTSAGACNALSYVSHQIGRTVDINATFCGDKRYLDPLGLLKTGEVFHLDFLLKDVAEELIPFDFDKYREYASDRIESYAVSTNLATGEGEYLRVRDMRTDYEYVRASSSLPLFAKTVRVDGLELLDGGVADSIPMEFSQSCGNDKLIIVLTQHESYRKKKSKLNRSCAKKYKAYPEFVKAFENRYLRYNESVRYAQELQREGKAIIIRPNEPVEISKFERNGENLRALHRKGYEDAKRMYEQIKSFVSDCENLIWE